MAINTKAVKNRISSVNNTRKITKAMQMIAAVKMRKAVDSAVRTKVYANLARQLLEDLSSVTFEHPLLKKPKAKNKSTLVVMITSNRGLCGSYNANVAKNTEKFLLKTELQPDVIALGKKAALFAKRRQLKLVALYEKLSENFNFDHVSPIAKELIDLFVSGKYDEIYVSYTNYISGLNQKVEIQKLLPLERESIFKIAEAEQSEEEGEMKNSVNDQMNDEEGFIFEPNKETLMNYVLPKLVEVIFYRTVLDSAASEHSSRMMAMKSATESAADMINELTLEYNKGRQSAITQEIAEITSGADALNF